MDWCATRSSADEYIHTLNAEADRLSRLVGNVLDYSRLENQRPRLNRTRVTAADLLAQVGGVWQGRCQDADKELVIETIRDGRRSGPLHGRRTGAAGPRQSARQRLQIQPGRGRSAASGCASDAHGRRMVFEVEDRGPGVPKRERRSIFRDFRRGRTADATGRRRRAGAGAGAALGAAAGRRADVTLLGVRGMLSTAPAFGKARTNDPILVRTPGLQGILPIYLPCSRQCCASFKARRTASACVAPRAQCGGCVPYPPSESCR